MFKNIFIVCFTTILLSLTTCKHSTDVDGKNTNKKQLGAMQFALIYCVKSVLQFILLLYIPALI